jgi:CHAT domain-containing protein/tetratricopeptide (TPR) repeat protein
VEKSRAKKGFGPPNRINKEKLALTRPLDRHLDNVELDALVFVSPDPVLGSGDLADPILLDVQRHVESCGDCRRKLQTHRDVQGEISRLGSTKSLLDDEKCPKDADWLDLVAGLLPEAKAEELMSHAAQCDHCGPLVRDAVETLSDEATAAEANMMAGLSSARPEWQKALAGKLGRVAQNIGAVPDRTPWWRGFVLWPRPVFVVGTVAVVTVMCWLGLSLLRSPSAERLLAQAYTEHRTLEIRIPGAKYAPMRIERKTDGSSLDKPPSLLKAEALIGENLRKNPSDPAWLDARARADLLDGNYESAIHSLRLALEARPDSPELLTDLGSAYFLRAKSADRAVDYGNAIESLGKALAKSPDDPVALFNRALACEQMFLYTQAVDDWEHYLRVDPQGEWADEARKRLAAVKQKLEQREKSLAEPLLTPQEISRAGSDNVALRDRINGRVEEYVKLATTDWFSTAFSKPASERSGETQLALAALAAITREKHDDFWLADFLSHTTGVQFRDAISSLAISIRANEHGDYSAGRSSAHSAAELFRAAANRAGELRAQAEEVYSDHLLWEGERCTSLLRRLDEPLKQNRYAWLRSQMGLEESNCANLVGDLGNYQAALGRATDEARIHNYSGLFLRGLGFQALAAASLGDANTSFGLASKGLGLFWSGQVDLMKGYNLYTDLDAAADGLRLPNLQVAVWQQATTLIEGHPNVLLRAMAHRWYGNAAYLANVPGLAESEFSKASALFAASPQTAATTRDYMDAEVWLAQVEIRQGDVEGAASRLQAIKSTLDRAPSFDPEIGFYSTEADIGMRRVDPVATESALQSAIFLAEWALNSLPSEGERHQWAEQTRSAYRDVVEWKLRQGDVSSALEFWEWYRGAELRASEHSVRRAKGNQGINNPPDPHDAPPLPSLKAVANRLPLLRDETVIAYGTFPDGIEVWVYDDRGIFARWVPTALPQVQDLTIRFQRLCSDPSSDLSALRKSARSLYDLLIAPVEDRLVPGRTLLFEPDDFLETIPLEALVDTRGHYLAERFAVVVTPGLYRSTLLRRASAITDETPALIVSVPVVAEERLTPLADAENEAQAVADRFTSARWLQGNSATLSAIRQEIRGVAVFHFAGHAVASPLRSGLVLAEVDPNTQRSRLIGPESLGPREIDHLQLAVLSACHTGAESQVGGSGTETLAQTLLHAGVPHVVASRWNVDSSETANFMRHFYAQLLGGQDAASSMRTAQLALASQPASAHPYYWSAFELQGIR